MVDAGIQVVEGIAEVERFCIILFPPLVHDGKRRHTQDIEPRAAQGNVERSTVTPKWSLKVQVTRSESQRCATVILLHVPLLCLHIDDGREPPAEACRKACLIEMHTLDGFIVESGEDTAEMVHLINRITINEEEVFIRVTAPHKQPRYALRTDRDARRKLERPHYVRLSQQGRSSTNQLLRHLHRPHLGVTERLFTLSGSGHQHFANRSVRLKQDGQCCISRKRM